MWMALQQAVIIAKAVNIIWRKISVHSKGNSVTASLLNTIKPTEHSIQHPTPEKISLFSLCEEAILKSTYP